MSRDINLLTGRHRTRLSRGVLRRRFIGMYVLAFMITGSLWVWLHMQALRREAVAAVLEGKATAVDATAHEADALEQRAADLIAQLAQYQRVAMPIQTSRVVATIVDLLPDNVYLSSLRLWVEETPVSRSVMEDLKEKVNRTRGKAAAQREMQRSLMCQLEGLSQTDLDSILFFDRLERSDIFRVVRPDYKPSEQGDVRSFSVTFQVDLDVRYEFLDTSIPDIAVQASGTGIPFQTGSERSVAQQPEVGP